ncbi:hypothetical protein AAVH_07635 [Aphelenchoides avenae]|nr:hypothetical protein AAVH_07635 [Aphelenchus avenae]
MRSFAVLLALLPLSFSATQSFYRDYFRNRGGSEAEELSAGRTCVHDCQINVHRDFGILCNDCRPRDHQEYCKFAKALGECFAKCPESPAFPLLRQDAEINAQVCAKDFDERNFTAFLDNQDELSKAWDHRGEFCRDGRLPDLQTCSGFINCYFGEALNAVEDGFDELAVASYSTQFKISLTLLIGHGTWTKTIVENCAVVFKPYEARNVSNEDTFETNSTYLSSLSAPACIRYCQATAVLNFARKPQQNQRSDKAEYCEYNRALDDCLGKCQESPITPIIEQKALVTAYVCAADFGEEQLKAFFEGHRNLSAEWFKQAERSCGKMPGRDMEKMFEKCSLYLNCFFGEAVDAMEDADVHYDDAVVIAVAGHFQLKFAPLVGRGVWSKDVVDE